MSMPGFTADASLAPSQSDYYGRFAPPAGEDTVDPQFLGAIREVFEKAAHGLSQAVGTAADGLRQAIDRIRPHGPGDPPFYCRSWVQDACACNGNSPQYRLADIVSRCVSINPTNSLVCAGLAGSLYGLVSQACRESPGQVGSLVPRICPGS
jgi:hypothetical protein